MVSQAQPNTELFASLTEIRDMLNLEQSDVTDTVLNVYVGAADQDIIDYVGEHPTEQNKINQRKRVMVKLITIDMNYEGVIRQSDDNYSFDYDSYIKARAMVMNTIGKKVV